MLSLFACSRSSDKLRHKTLEKSQTPCNWARPERTRKRALLSARPLLMAALACCRARAVCPIPGWTRLHTLSRTVFLIPSHGEVTTCSTRLLHLTSYSCHSNGVVSARFRKTSGQKYCRAARGEMLVSNSVGSKSNKELNKEAEHGTCGVLNDLVSPVKSSLLSLCSSVSAPDILPPCLTQY